MKIGVIFPQVEFGNDPIAVRDYAQTAEGLGFHHVSADDHIIGPNPDRPGGWRGWVTYRTAFHEPFVLFSFMAGVTQRLRFTNWILILPQRPTVLVAKQAATLDVLSGGRLRLGVGNGWNEIEYISLGQDFHTRGRRIEEQVELLRQLWTQPLVDFAGRWHMVPDAGINPLPVQQPIPIWFGGGADAVLRRAARLGDGWMPLAASADDARPALDQLDGYLAEAGRTRSAFGIDARIGYDSGKPDEWAKAIEGWRSAGATHLSLGTTGCGFDTPAKHMQALRGFAEAVGFRSI